jgi:LysM repeat protein
MKVIEDLPPAPRGANAAKPGGGARTAAPSSATGERGDGAAAQAPPAPQSSGEERTAESPRAGSDSSRDREMRPAADAGDVRLASDEEVLIPERSERGAAGDSDDHRAGGDDERPGGADDRSGGTGTRSSGAASPSSAQETAASGQQRDPESGPRFIAAARKRYEAGRVIEARHELNAMLDAKRATDEADEIRALLTRIADETIFGKQRIAEDPLCEIYTIQKGDRLIHIARKFGVPPEALMMINGIGAPERIRENQRIKVPEGPFHAKIYKSDFRMDVYLQDLFVRSYRVGLGADQGTPTGVWRVKNRLPNPTYFPSASAPDKRIIPPDDPMNPLGERWIGLEGVEGEAVGHEGYGIHGTIEPDSIGRAVSLGCIRMHNEDVAVVYSLLLPGKSTVTILP